MIDLLRAEWRKTFSVKLWWGMLLGAMAFAAIAVIAQIANAGSARSGLAPLGSESTQHSVFASGVSGEIFALIVGIILITSEYRHFTSRPTFLIEPRRGHVIVAKVVMSAVVGVIYAFGCVAITLAIAIPWFGAKGVPIQWATFGIPSILIGVALVVIIYAVLGLGVGVLVQNQIAAVIGGLAYLLVLERLVSVIPVIKDVYKFLPGAAASALTQESGSLRSTSTAVTLLSPLEGGLVVLGWGLLFAFLGWIVSIRRDVQ